MAMTVHAFSKLSGVTLNTLCHNHSYRVCQCISGKMYSYATYTCNLIHVEAKGHNTRISRLSLRRRRGPARLGSREGDSVD